MYVLHLQSVVGACWKQGESQTNANRAVEEYLKFESVSGSLATDPKIFPLFSSDTGRIQMEIIDVRFLLAHRCF